MITIQKLSGYYQMGKAFIFEQSLSVYELTLKTIEKTDEIIDNLLSLDGLVASNYTDLNSRKENSVDISNNRKLSAVGNFTGTINGRQSLDVLAEVDTSTDQIAFLTGQFSDGVTGLVIECGFFTDGEIARNYDGGVW